MKNLYERYLLPRLIHRACNSGPANFQRSLIVPQAEGTVLEIGIGSGLNLTFYDPEKVKAVVGIDRSKEVWERRDVSVGELGFEFVFEEGFAENLPLENHSVDTILTTFTLCSVSGLGASFEEMRRVLKPSGKLLFCEHGKAPEKAVNLLQNALNPVWKRMGGGCHLNRDIPTLIKANGFQINEMDTGYITGLRFASYNFWGSAKMK
ncbi:class I SAM-dependent methyltransferase [Flammeovirgaceae bacterium SG7u.111]|nr:class I SAM-dependent methyltransferase [Flammeovirgaceae bacterium SG7u.132]WPO34291.1 class I SAM-dependent methyltransferase [Flammeovirgaceae bacterium SG7u.111]